MKIKQFITEVMGELSDINIVGDIELTLAVDMFGHVIQSSDSTIKVVTDSVGNIKSLTNK